MKGWVKTIYSNSPKELKEVEEGINACFKNNDAINLSKNESWVLKELEGIKKDLLESKEKRTWRRTSGAIRL